MTLINKFGVYILEDTTEMTDYNRQLLTEQDVWNSRKTISQHGKNNLRRVRKAESREAFTGLKKCYCWKTTSWYQILAGGGSCGVWGYGGGSFRYPLLTYLDMALIEAGAVTRGDRQLT